MDWMKAWVDAGVTLPRCLSKRESFVEVGTQTR